jgi:nucleoid DNA-binding protein
MRKPHCWALAALTATLGVILAVATPAQSQKAEPSATVPQAVAKKTKVSEQDVIKVLEALGPAIRDKLSNGETVELPGLGTLRVVRIAEHKDMVRGRPATIDATNTVEFEPTEELVKASNAVTAAPARTVPAFEYLPLPGQTPSERAPYIRAPNIRTR